MFYPICEICKKQDQFDQLPPLDTMLYFCALCPRMQEAKKLQAEAEAKASRKQDAEVKTEKKFLCVLTT